MFLTLALGTINVALGNVPERGAYPRVVTSADSTLVSDNGTIFGIVRSGATGAVLTGASIKTEDGRITTSDSDGRYVVRDVPLATREIVVTLMGYNALTLSVTVPSHEALRVDVLMSPVWTSLAPIHIVAQRVVPPVALSVNRGNVDGRSAWHWSGDAADAATATGEPDLFRLLADDPNVFGRPDRPAVMMDRGTGSDETLFMLDGFPVWNPVHSGDGLSVISPDIVGGLTLNDGVIPAQYGGRLGSVVDLHTLNVTRDSAHRGVSVGSVASRLLFSTPFHSGETSGGVVLALRRSNADLFRYQTVGRPFLNRWADGVGMLALSHGATTLQVLGLRSTDQLGLRSVTHQTPVGTTDDLSQDDGATIGATDTSQKATGGLSSNGSILSRFPWSTQTIGVLWTQRVAPTAHLDTRLWQADFRANGQEGADSGTAMLANSARQFGVSSQIVWGNTTAGASLEALSTSYHVTMPPGSVSNANTDTASGTRPFLDLQAHPTLVAAFVDRRWGSPDANWSAQTGLRATTLLGDKTYLDPRVSAALHVTHDVSLTAGYTRTHQFIQSLRNQSAPLSALIATDFPIAAGSGGSPVAHSDVLTVGMAARLSAQTRVIIDAYARWLGGVAIPNPASTYLFANHTFEVAAGRATGVGAALTGRTGWMSWETVYGVGQTRYSTLAQAATIAPNHALSQTAMASVTVQLGRRTQARIVGWGETGPQAMQTMWFSQSLAGGSETRIGEESDDSRELDRTVNQTGLGEAQRSSYLRFDAHVAHDWTIGHGRDMLSAYLSAVNILNRANVVSYNLTNGTVQQVTLTPRSLLAGISWRY